ncbi:MAG TPA: hypothetical protein VIX86_04300 [Streptosporangiaceae bacterium]
MADRPDRGAGFLAHRGLIAVATGAALAEAGLLIVVAPAARALAPQVTALPPLAVFHDLRWLYGVPPSWPGFVLVLTGLLLARSALNAVLVWLAWPRGSARPSPLAAWRYALGFTVFACLLLSPLVSLTVGLAILPFSWPFLATMAVMLMIALPLSHGGVAGSWWRMLPPPVAASWLLTDVAVLSVAAAAIDRLPATGALAVTTLAGLVNARAWFGLTTACVARAHRQPAPRPQRLAGRLLAWPARIPAVPVATLAAITVVTVAIRLTFLANAPVPQAAHSHAGTALAGVSKMSQPGRGHAPTQRWRQPPVLEVPGFGSHCCAGPQCCGYGRPLAQVMPGTLVQSFSYRGLDRAGNPLPYGVTASNLPLPVLGDRIAAQVWRLYARTGRRVDVVAESEGSLGVYAMLAQHPGVPVAAVVLLSPIVAPGQVGYPVGGSSLVPGSELRAVVWFVGGLSPFGTSGAQTLISSVSRVGARFAAAATRHPRLPWLELVPLADAVTLPACRLPPDVLVVPALHGQLLSDPLALRIVREFLTHQRVSRTSALRATAEFVAAAASAWRLPQPTTPSPPCQR